MRPADLGVWVLVAGAIGCGGVDGDAASSESAALSATVNQQLAVVRQATGRYHHVANAIADGYVEASPCEASAAGTMGIHYVNFGLVDATLDATQPEALLYLPTPGGLRLVAVEYLYPILTATGPYMGCGVNDSSCPPADPPPAPTVFDGQPFDGPMAGHVAGMPWHYDQHVWIWSHNPAGAFEAWNPALTCPAE